MANKEAIVDIPPPPAVVYTDEQIHETFLLFDKDESGTIDAAELEDALAVIGIDVTPEDRELYQYDDDADTLNEEEFRDLIRDKLNEIHPQERFEDSLTQFDADGSHIINKDKLIEILTERGESPLSTEDAEALIAAIDFNDDGQISFTELAQAIYYLEDF